MGSTVTILSPLRKSTWTKVLENTSKFSYKKPFVEMIREHPLYGRLMKVKCVYEIKLVHLESPHWYLLVRTKDSMLSYISLEIRTTDMSDLVQFTREIDSPSPGVLSDVGIYEGTLLYLCELADRVVKEMGSYDLLTCNCQTFCNQLLKKMGKSEYPTSTKLLDGEIDLLCEEIREYFPTGAKNSLPMVSCKTKLNSTNQKCSNFFAASTTGANPSQTAVTKRDPGLPENVPSLSVSDLTWLHKTLIPIEHSWKDIGYALHVDAQTLTTIENEYQSAKQCLCEMLRQYLQQRTNPPSWNVLVGAVEEENSLIAKSIVEEAKRIYQQKR